MRVQCVLCDAINSIEDWSVEAKRLRNHPIHTHMCDPCSARIAAKSRARMAGDRSLKRKSTHPAEADF